MAIELAREEDGPKVFAEGTGWSIGASVGPGWCCKGARGKKAEESDGPVNNALGGGSIGGCSRAGVGCV